jgi:hypothetical protein
MPSTRQPQSRFEKFAAGIELIKLHQPAAEIDVVAGHILIGTTEDPHFSPGARKHLRGFGFFEDETNNMFAYPVDVSG